MDQSYCKKSKRSRKSNGGVAKLKDHDYYRVQRSSSQEGGHKGAGGAVNSGVLAHRLAKQKKLLQQRLLIRKARLIFHRSKHLVGKGLWGTQGPLNTNCFSEPGEPVNVSPVRVEEDTLEGTSLLLQPSAEQEAVEHNEDVSWGGGTCCTPNA